jgi:nucleoside phosphorylase
MTWLLVASEAQEFQGILRRARRNEPLPWPDAQFARQVSMNGKRLYLVANGPGAELASAVLHPHYPVDLVISTGFCGALDRGLRIGDIVVAGEMPERTATSFVRGRVLSLDRVVVTAAEKRSLRETTGASIVEMEYAAVSARAREWGVPCCSVRAVSDTADQDMPMDFNGYRDAAGRFDRARIARAALAHPFSRVPALLRLVVNCRKAADSLGEFFADSQT